MRPLRLEYAGWFLLAVYAVAGFATLTGSHDWGDDWAQYVLHARNILSGAPYGDTGYVFNFDARYVGPPEYPPGLPLLLAPAIALFGIDIVALKAVCFACFVAMLPIACAALARSFGTRPALAAVLLFALHEQVWSARQVIGTEAPYMLFTMAALWHASREGPPRGGWATAGIVLGALAYAGIVCRSIGIALVAALLLDAWSRRRPPAWYAGFLGTLAVLLVIQKSLLVAPQTYSAELVVPNLDLVLNNVRGYWNVALWLLPMPVGALSHVALAAVVVLALAGAWAGLGADVFARGPRALRDRLARVPLPVWYVLAYLGALGLASIAPGPRYLLPVAPIVLALAASGVAHLARRTASARRTVAMCVTVVAVYYAGLYASAREPRDDQLATCGACREMYAFVQARTPPGSVIAFAKPRALALLAGRPAWIWNPDYEPDVFRAKLRERARFLVVAAPGTVLRERYPRYFDNRFQDEIGTTVFRNAMFTVVELRDVPR